MDFGSIIFWQGLGFGEWFAYKMSFRSIEVYVKETCYLLFFFIDMEGLHVVIERTHLANAVTGFCFGSLEISHLF